MDEYIKLFETHSEYETYILGDSKVLPNVSFCKDLNEVHYNPWVETRIVAKFNITDISDPTQICGDTSNFSEIEIDGVSEPNVVETYQFETIGEHIVKYTLIDLTSVDEMTFRDCRSLTSVTIPNSVTTIGSYAFYQCSSLVSITMSNNLTTIGTLVFSYCYNLISVTIPNNVISIGEGAFDNCSGLTSITFGNNITSISNLVFYNCSGLTSITIPNSVILIGDDAFSECSGLTSVTVGNSVEEIGERAFEDCNNLTSIICNATVAPNIDSSTFRNIKTNGILTVPTGSTGYDDWWMNTDNYYLGKYNWTKIEQ